MPWRTSDRRRAAPGTDVPGIDGVSHPSHTKSRRNGGVAGHLRFVVVTRQLQQYVLEGRIERRGRAVVRRCLGDALLAATNSRWQVRAGEGEGRPSLGHIRAATLADNDARIRELPVVKAALTAFPDARLVEDDDNRHRSNS